LGNLRARFRAPSYGELHRCLEEVSKFRNRYVAHAEHPLTDATEAWEAMRTWLCCIAHLAQLASSPST